MEIVLKAKRQNSAYGLDQSPSKSQVKRRDTFDLRIVFTWAWKWMTQSRDPCTMTLCLTTAVGVTIKYPNFLSHQFWNNCTIWYPNEFVHYKLKGTPYTYYRCARASNFLPCRSALSCSLLFNCFLFVCLFVFSVSHWQHTEALSHHENNFGWGGRKNTFTKDRRKKRKREKAPTPPHKSGLAYTHRVISTF